MKMKNQKGFIAIVALGIVMLMSIFAIMIQSTTLDTVRGVKNSNNSYRAGDIAYSMTEYLRYVVSKVDAGYNLDEMICKYGKYADAKTKNSPKCEDILDFLVSDTDDVEVSIKIKGRNEDSEKFSGPCPGGLLSGCYVSPIAAEGSAGERCKFYKPDYKKTKSLVGHQGKLLTTGKSGTDGLPQLDYACNWNKLTFGSSLTDRATIPFYYDTKDGIKNTYYGNPPGLFAVRLRTPCLPCSENPKSGISRKCSANTDPTICKATERYTLNTNEKDSTPDDIVVQWQFSGTCEVNGKEKECGLIPKIVRNSKGEIDDGSSAISDSRINKENFSTPSFILILPKLDYAIDTNTYEISGKPLIKTLKNFKKPVFTLFLSDKLISYKNRNVPYLEYQILTNRVIASPSKQLEATVVVNDSIVTKTIYLEESKKLIDFAIQN